MIRATCLFPAPSTACEVIFVEIRSRRPRNEVACANADACAGAAQVRLDTFERDLGQTERLLYARSGLILPKSRSIKDE